MKFSIALALSAATQHQPSDNRQSQPNEDNTNGAQLVPASAMILRHGRLGRDACSLAVKILVGWSLRSSMKLC
ncbi:hypothetical protein [Microvirga sp. TS319]|uniref:hypothetical protein n=1 Tax=Microvirga sp. TS319 TaxID=3241165 RepID=UPI00351A10EF